MNGTEPEKNRNPLPLSIKLKHNQSYGKETTNIIYDLCDKNII